MNFSLGLPLFYLPNTRGERGVDVRMKKLKM